MTLQKNEKEEASSNQKGMNDESIDRYYELMSVQQYVDFLVDVVH